MAFPSLSSLRAPLPALGMWQTKSLPPQAEAAGQVNRPFSQEDTGVCFSLLSVHRPVGSRLPRTISSIVPEHQSQSMKECPLCGLHGPGGFRKKQESTGPEHSTGLTEAAAMHWSGACPLISAR